MNLINFDKEVEEILLEIREKLLNKMERVTESPPSSNLRPVDAGLPQ